LSGAGYYRRERRMKAEFVHGKHFYIKITADDDNERVLISQLLKGQIEKKSQSLRMGYPGTSSFMLGRKEEDE
jgi:hypothetical protein